MKHENCKGERYGVKHNKIENETQAEQMKKKGTSLHQGDEHRRARECESIPL